MEPPPPVSPPATPAFPSVLLAAAAALGVAALVLLGPRALAPQPEPAAPPAPAPLADEVLRLERIGPRVAWVWHGDARLGRLDVGPDEHVTGDALVHLPRLLRRVGRRSVAIVQPAGLEPVVADKLRNLCVVMGATNTRIVTPVDGD